MRVSNGEGAPLTGSDTLSHEGAAAPAPARARRGRPPKDGAGADTRAAILDAAEELFSQHGLDAVSLREVARRAGVDTALLHYYFKTKPGLFDAVFARRAEILNAERLEALDRYEREHGGRMTVEGAIDAFLTPVLGWSARGDQGWRNYFALVAVVSNTPAWGGETMTRYFDPVIRRLLDLLRKALPDADDCDLYWSYHMLSGALMLTLSETGRLDLLSGGLCRSADMETAQRKMVAFAAAGFRAACRKPGT